MEISFTYLKLCCLTGHCDVYGLVVTCYFFLHTRFHIVNPGSNQILIPIEKCIPTKIITCSKNIDKTSIESILKSYDSFFSHSQLIWKGKLNQLCILCVASKGYNKIPKKNYSPYLLYIQKCTIKFFYKSIFQHAFKINMAKGEQHQH